MIFQKKKSIRVVYTISRCDSCGLNNKKIFVPGDYIYKTSECAKCGGIITIQGIFGQEQL